MKENNIEIIEEIMQCKISNFIKKNRNMDPKELAQKVEELINKKEEMFNMNEEQLKEELKRMSN